ncbi:MAG: hypothetical protein KDD33_05485 [Bdellovibrionales bacterium]|nr:hypothetical protein [Bdellovibrionales bacterium]
MKALILSIVFVIALPLPSYAIFGVLAGHHGCPAQPKGNHLVVSFEGLGNLGVNHANISNAFQSNASYTPLNLSRFGGSTAYNCIERLKRQNPKLKVSIIGHSCGGVTAANLANKLASNGMAPNNVMTIDPRCHHALYTCADSKPAPAFNKAPGVGQWVNFYQCGGGLAGQKVSGACNARINAAHVNMPGDSRVRSAALAMLQGKTIRKAGTSCKTDTAPSTMEPQPVAAQPGNLLQKIFKPRGNGPARRQMAVDRAKKRYNLNQDAMRKWDQKISICRGGRKCTYGEATMENSTTSQH